MTTPRSQQALRDQFLAAESEGVWRMKDRLWGTSHVVSTIGRIGRLPAFLSEGQPNLHCADIRRAVLLLASSQAENRSGKQIELDSEADPKAIQPDT